MGIRHRSKSGNFILPVTLTDESGSFIDLGPSNKVGDAFSVYNSSAYESGSIITGSAATLYKIIGYHSGSATTLQVHNTGSAVTFGDTPSLIHNVAADSNINLDCGRFGVPFTDGISIVNSNVDVTFGTGSADTWYTVLYK